MNEISNIQPLSDILSKYNLQEIYTEVDEIQDLVDKCDSLVHDNLIYLGKISEKGHHRAKSSKSC